jgi:hypothetical protein
MTSDSPHDALVRRTFSSVEYAAAEFRALLPARLVARTDFSTLELCSGSYVDDTLAASQSDLLFSVRISDKPALLYVLFEHQSSVDKLMPLRLLRYVVRILVLLSQFWHEQITPLRVSRSVSIGASSNEPREKTGETGARSRFSWHESRDAHPRPLRRKPAKCARSPRPNLTDQVVLERHVQEARAPSLALPLPVVVPLVLHHSETGWTAARRLEELFHATLIGDPQILPLIPRLGFVLDDISQLSDEALEARALGLVPALTLWALRDARSPTRLVQSFNHWANAMAELVAAPNGSEALWTIFRYIALVADDSVSDTLSRAFDAAKPEVKEAIMTLAERWQAEGEARGIAKGKAEGKAEMLSRLLLLKFGHLPDDAQQRLGQAAEAQLDLWTERLLTAETLADVMVSES